MENLNKIYNIYFDKTPDFGFNGLGQFVYERTYSRIKEDGTKENWNETVYRVVKGLYEYIDKDKQELIEEKADQMYEYMYDMKFLPSGRSLWGMGTKIPEKCGAIALNSCSYFSFNEDKPENVFSLIADVLMLGCGASFDTRPKQDYYIYQPKEECIIFVISDDREGWVESIKLLLMSYFYENSKTIQFDYEYIRPKGYDLKTFGGKSSGPEPLEECIEGIRTILNNNIGSKLNSRIITDICCLIARMVVSGNVRRSALLAGGYEDDVEFMNLKDYARNPDRSSFGYCTNNSVITTSNQNYLNIIKRLKQNGEPAIIFIDNLKNYGLMFRDKDYKDNYENVLCNPCGEVTLRSHEFCNLAEVFLNRIDNIVEFTKVLKYAFLYCKVISMIKTCIEKSDRIIEENRRVGISLSGITQFLSYCDMDLDKLRAWLTIGYIELEKYDEKISKIFNINTSIKRTCIKPSGTLSLLAGAIPSITFPYFRKYIRRVRLDRKDPLISKYEKLGYKVEKDVVNPNTMIINFIVELDNCVVLNDGNIETDLCLASLLQMYWADNNVSMTIQFDPNIDNNEFNKIIIKYSNKLKTMCFLPRNCTYYPQLPMEELTNEQYEEEVKSIKSRKINYERHNWFNDECENIVTDGVCENYCDNDKCMNL